ncbi:MAG: amino acid ABC transporter substrate-binding protein [Hydrogeniiclostridium sp.]
MKKILSMLLALSLAAVSFVGCSQNQETQQSGSEMSNAAANVSEGDSQAENAGDDSLQKIKDKGQLVLGLDDSFPPMGFRDTDNNIVGYDIDLAKEVAERMGVELIITPVDWDYKETELNDGNVDCLWNGMSVDDERKEKMNLSEPYMENRQVVVVLADSGINTLADLAGKSVILQAGSTAVGALDSKEDVKSTLKEVTEVPDNVQAMMELGQGTGDAVVMDEVVARYYISKSDNPDQFKVLDEALSDEVYAVGFRKADQSLRDEVQKILGEMKADGTLKTITEKWFGSDISIVPDNE